jgi:hypothetical protein
MIRDSVSLPTAMLATRPPQALPRCLWRRVPRPSPIKFEPGMLHVVEIRFAGENFKEVISRVRGWLNGENASTEYVPVLAVRTRFSVTRQF